MAASERPKTFGVVPCDCCICSRTIVRVYAQLAHLQQQDFVLPMPPLKGKQTAQCHCAAGT